MPNTLDMELHAIRQKVYLLHAKCLETTFGFLVERDRKRPVDGRIFVQCVYDTLDTVTGREKEWKGRKWYLSDHMTDDEIVKTCYAAFRAAVEHEVMEGFKWNGHRVFNPHTPFTELVKASVIEAHRPDHRV